MYTFYAQAYADILRKIKLTEAAVDGRKFAFLESAKQTAIFRRQQGSITRLYGRLS